jgi:hypothetical protein
MRIEDSDLVKLQLKQSYIASFIIGLALLLAMVSCGPPKFSELSGNIQLQGEMNSEGIQIFLPGTQYRAMTDENGAFRIVDIPPGNYTLVAQMDGYDEHRQSVEVLERDANSVKSIILNKTRIPAGSISGFVQLNGESDHRDIIVLLVGTPHNTLTSNTGYYKFDGIMPGLYPLLMMKEGYQPYTQYAVEIKNGEETTIEEIKLIAMSPTPTPLPEPPKLGKLMLRGIALLEDEQTHDGIMVSLESLPEKYTISDASGTFILSDLDNGPYTLILTKPGFLEERIEKAVPVDIGSTQICGIVNLQKEFTPEYFGVLQGRVYLEGQQDHSNTTVRLLGMSIPVITDEKGRYKFVGIPAGKYTLVADHVGYEQGGLPETHVIANQISQVADITLRATDVVQADGTGTIEGFAYLEGEQDNTGITVVVDGTSHSAVTSLNGKYVLEDIPANIYTLIFTRGGFKNEYVGGIEVAVGETALVEDVFLQPDIEPPFVMDTFPRDRARQVPIIGFVDVLVKFSERMDGPSVKRSVIIEPPVNYDVFFDRESEYSDLDVLHIRMYHQGQYPMFFNTPYQIVITPEARTPKGISLAEPFVFSFMTDGPLIIASIPEQRQSEFIIPGPRKLLIETNAPVDMKSFERSLRIRPDPDSIPMLETYMTDVGMQIFIDVDMRANSRYRVQIGNSMRTIDGLRFSNTPYTLQFRTLETTPDGDQPGKSIAFA